MSLRVPLRRFARALPAGESHNPLDSPDRRPATPFNSLLIAGAMVFSVGCSTGDPYTAKFDRISIGSSRSAAIELMGSPTSVNSLEAPFVKVEVVAWRAKSRGRVHVLYVAQDRVVAKTVID
jgi:hypothetical protein